MSQPDYKALKKLADACRKAGIRSYKDANCEFTLTDDAPISNYKRKTIQKTPTEAVIDDTFKSDQLTEEQLLFYSVVSTESEHESN